MNDEISPPPIASPYGDAKVPLEAPLLQSRITPIIPIRLSCESALRSSFLAFFCPINFFTVLIIAGIITLILYPTTSYGHNLLSLFSPFELWVSCIAGFIFLMVSIFALWSLLFSRRFEVEIQPRTLCIHYPRRDTLLPWSNIIWILHFNGDVWLATPGEACLIPRESFTSCAQSRQFANLIRQLWLTNGEAWATTFGQTNSTRKHVDE